MLRLHFLFMACVVLVCSVPHRTAAASFNCAKAVSVAEQLICGDPQLSRLDDELAALYHSAKAGARDQVSFKKETNEEWRRREACVDRDCLVAWYQQRNAQLRAELNGGSAVGPGGGPEPVAARTTVAPVPGAASSVAAGVGGAAPHADGSSPLVFACVVIGGLLVIVWVRGQVSKGKRIIAARQVGRAEVSAGLRRETVRVDAGSQKREARTGTARTGTARSGTARSEMAGTGTGTAEGTVGAATVWIRPGQSVTVHGVSLRGGMLYVGSTLVGGAGAAEPAQINPALEVDPQPAESSERLFAYWPSYTAISPVARRTYLAWLAGGRQDPAANIGYVFLFFYGLERRVLVDAAVDGAARAEIAVIVAEIERLRGIYDNNSFLRYSSDLLDFLAAGAVEAGLYLSAAPPATASRGLSTRLRVGLGQCAVDGRPVPAEWALAWARSDANLKLPRAAARCARLFDVQFKTGYAERFGEGLLLSVNRTKLAIAYRPASGGLSGQHFSAGLGALPDVTTVVTPVKKLQAVVDAVAESLEPYSRFIGRHAHRVGSMEAVLLLPRALWPAAVRDAVGVLDGRVGAGMVVIKLEELLRALGGASVLSRALVKHLAQVLQEWRLGVEPDVLAGAKTPRADESVVLFRLGDQDGESGGKAGGYEAAAVMLDLAITLANADGKISGREIMFLNAQVDAWVHVGLAAQRRLRARLRLGIVYPPTLASLRHRIEPLPAAARAGLAKLLAGLALADGKLRPASVKHLEKVYALLGIDVSALYSELHVESAARERSVAPTARLASGAAAATPKRPTVLASAMEGAKAGCAGRAESAKKADGAKEAEGAKKAEGTAKAEAGAKVARAGLGLDLKRVAALQAETERVTALLSKVFAELEAPAVVARKDAGLGAAEDAELDAEEASEGAGELESDERSACLLGLDAEHSAFLRALLTRTSWSRAELSDMAADMELMLDGALERVNEAALNKFDCCIAEGDDPIEIEQDLMESVSA